MQPSHQLAAPNASSTNRSRPRQERDIISNVPGQPRNIVKPPQQLDTPDSSRVAAYDHEVEKGKLQLKKPPMFASKPGESHEMTLNKGKALQSLSVVILLT